jgi:glycosyltransferase involved in cell wall biosynthesis
VARRSRLDGLVAPGPWSIVRRVHGDDTGVIDVSVIVCVRNGADRMHRQLDAVLGQEWDRPWELLVVDNGSTDDTAAVAAAYARRDERVRVVTADERRGLSYARNVGVAQARGRSVVFCDDDDRVGDGWLRAMGDALREHQVVAPRMEYAELSDPAALTGRADFQSNGVETVFGYPIVNGVGGWRRDLWLSLGGNDESLDYTGEDHDMALRAYLTKGVTPYFCADAVYHCGRRAGRGPTFRQARRYGRAQVVLARRYGRDRPGARAAPGTVLRQWAWIVKHLPDAFDAERSTEWAWRTGLRAGRLEGGLRRDR